MSSVYESGQLLQHQQPQEYSQQIKLNESQEAFETALKSQTFMNFTSKLKPQQMSANGFESKMSNYLNKNVNENNNSPGSLHRRKNASRETTCMLKAWLNEHRRNPYPSKGEKVMLAIITKMTLTQVSTWFANARRRLKKENKMTWIPRHRNSDQNDDDDDGASDSDLSDCDQKQLDEEMNLDDEIMFDQPGLNSSGSNFNQISCMKSVSQSTSDLFMKELSRLEELASVKSENNDISSNSSTSPRPLQQISPLSNSREQFPENFASLNTTNSSDDALNFIRNTLMAITRIPNLHHNSYIGNNPLGGNVTALANTAILLAKSISSGKGDFITIPPPVLHQISPDIRERTLDRN